MAYKSPYSVAFTSDKPVVDVAIGAMAGLLIVTINALSPAIAIALPPPLFPADMGFLMSFVQKFANLIYTCGFAPIFEEVIFRGFAFYLFYLAFKDEVVAILGQAGVFMWFHWKVYGTEMLGAFVGAGIFGLLAGVVFWMSVGKARRGNVVRGLLGVIIMHVIVNFHLMSKVFQFSMGGG